MKKIDSKHEEYNEYLPLWKKCERAYEGQEEIHKHGETYLPMLSGQTPDEYKKYLGRAMFFNATGRTVEGMVGMIMRKEPIITVPDSMLAIVEDFDLKGTHLNDFADTLLTELTKTNRVGILIDFPQQSTVGMTVAQMEASGIRPYAAMYDAESIIDWQFRRINNRYMLVMVKLTECDDDGNERIRLLELTEVGYTVSIYIKTDDGYKETPDDVFVPLMNNAPLRYIPFIMDSKIFKPPLLDLVNVNLAHYRNSADYEHGLHFTGLPTPIFWGANLTDDAGNAMVSIGSSTAYGFPNPEGHAEYLEFTGSGLGALKTAMDDKVNYMVALGSRYLGAEKRAAETAEAMTIRNAGENSIMAKIAGYASVMLTKSLRIMAEWSRIDPSDVSIEINRDVTPNSVTPQLFQQLTAAYMSGAISYETYFANLQQGEIIDSQRNIDDERADIQDGGMTGNVIG